MPKQHQIDMPDYSVIVAIDDDDTIALDISAHPDIAQDVGSAVMKLLESDAGRPIVEACINPLDQRLQETAKNLLRKYIKIIPPEEDDASAEQEDQME